MRGVNEAAGAKEVCGANEAGREWRARNERDTRPWPFLLRGAGLCAKIKAW